MKALSVRAPWWWAILHGKPVENRDWSTRFRGRVYLHASKFWRIGEIEDDWDDVLHMAKLDGIIIPRASHQELKSAAGCIVGSVEIMDCIHTNSINSAFFVGDYGFVLRNPITFKTPTPFKGALGFFDVPDNLVNFNREE